MTDENLKPCRDAFEEFMRRGRDAPHEALNMTHGEYDDDSTHLAWGAWQAALKTRTQEPTGDAVEALTELRQFAMKYAKPHWMTRLNQIADQIQSALQSPAAGNAILAGYALVPIEPTMHMLNEFYGQLPPNEEGELNDWRNGYRAMIAAAPKGETK